MIKYPNNYYNPVYLDNAGNDRYFFIPFLTGALAGGAAVGLTRPRPIYNVAPNQGMGYNPAMSYGNYSYSYYYPTNYRPY